MKGRLKPVPPVEPGAPPRDAPEGGFCVRDGEEFYRIRGYHRMPPFLMTLPSDTDLWMFIASGGGLTAGRVDSDGSLFPYLTVDQLHDAHHHTGPVTLLRVARGPDGPVLWEPFAADRADDPAVERNLYKSLTGHRLVFEEIDHELALAFAYEWAACDEYGWVRSATLHNQGTSRVVVSVIDGLRNVLPFGAPLALYQRSSSLVDAYKRAEVDPATGLGVFALTAGITDRPEALEVLRANTVWCCGPAARRVHLSAEPLAAFRLGRAAAEEHVLRGARGNYLVSFDAELEPAASSTWRLACDVGRDHRQIVALRHRLLRDDDLDARIAEAVRLAGEELRRNVGSADGIQLSARREAWSHHFANVLFNNMRGGVFWRNHDVPVADFARFLRARHAEVAERQAAFVSGLPATVTAHALRQAARANGDADLVRLSHEYLPLHFGRRHGDPSRPWNRFSIRTRARDGERELNYEGNWRDIFQNWEALGASFPAFLPGMVARFVNASTVDGFNPYRITRDGVDWETVSPDDPWSNIGYWGDHQIVYLLRLLEALHDRDPAALGAMLGEDVFSYADVPYRIRPYADILSDPRDTIVFDHARAALVAERVAARGADGRLLTGADGAVRHANLCEKLLVPALSKLSNLVPDAGIWMNTQRPEWNDANNALAGGAASVVTLCHLRRYLAFVAGLLGESDSETLPLAAEVAAWARRVSGVLAQEEGALAGRTCDPRDRRRVMDRLGEAFSEYRETVYARGLGGREPVALADLVVLCRAALRWVDHGIAANRRPDGLFHAYNLLEIGDDSVRVGHLPEMLEGQVAALSAGLLGAGECLEILERLFASALYRPSQRSFMLYPERELPDFLDRNLVPGEAAAAIPLLRALLADGNDDLLAQDADGRLRFHGDLASARAVEGALDRLAASPRWAHLVAQDRDAVLALYETVFRHRAYTGRSGAMYGYEGLGCIYWHMVAKLLLAVQEVLLRAEDEDEPPALRAALAAMYDRIRAGLGYRKTVAEYGAFPLDPYSHTPPDGGARQPGMTGQVKEEILARAGELGVRVEAGAVWFRPRLLQDDEFLPAPARFAGFAVDGQPLSIGLPSGSLAFTFCQVPVIYTRTAGEARIRVRFADGSTDERPGDRLDAGTSAALLARDGRIAGIEVAVPGRALRPAESANRRQAPDDRRR